MHAYLKNQNQKIFFGNIIILLDAESDNDSDTEFEDDIIIPMPKSSSAAEEIRINLEKCLGEKV